MNIKALKEHLQNNLEYVEEILEQIFHNVKYYDSKKQWYMSWTEDDNSTHIRLKSESLNYKDYKYNESGDIFTLIMSKLKINLGKCIEMVSNKSCFVGADSADKVQAFGGYFKKLKSSNSSNLYKYPKESINKYPKSTSKLLLNDGIDIETQKKFNIRYDSLTHRVVIPCYLEGSLIGAIGRYNKDFSGDVPKYLPILNYDKSKYLFGIDVNYSNLYEKSIILIESEKSVMKAYSLGHKNVIALGGNYISEFHKNLIYKLKPKEIIVMFDKGLDRKRIEELELNLTTELENAIINRVKVLKSNNFYYSPEISYLNLNSSEEIKDGDNIFDYEEIDHEEYIKGRVKYVG